MPKRVANFGPPSSVSSLHVKKSQRIGLMEFIRFRFRMIITTYQVRDRKHRIHCIHRSFPKYFAVVAIVVVRLVSRTSFSLPFLVLVLFSYLPTFLPVQTTNNGSHFWFTFDRRIATGRESHPTVLDCLLFISAA